MQVKLLVLLAAAAVSASQLEARDGGSYVVVPPSEHEGHGPSLGVPTRSVILPPAPPPSYTPPAPPKPTDKPKPTEPEPSVYPTAPPPKPSDSGKPTAPPPPPGKTVTLTVTECETDKPKPTASPPPTYPPKNTTVPKPPTNATIPAKPKPPVQTGASGRAEANMGMALIAGVIAVGAWVL